jgi:hypothetical protein
MFTNRTPTVTYMNEGGAPLFRNLSRSRRADNVIAAGSVMKDPSKGPMDRIVA